MPNPNSVSQQLGQQLDQVRNAYLGSPIDAKHQYAASTLFQALFALIAGAIFGLGLVLSQMISAQKILAFMDVAGLWDPSLALVIVGALLVGVPAFLGLRHFRYSLSGFAIERADLGRISPQLIIGSLVFGAGWGLVGMCPAPAVVNAAHGDVNSIIFVGSMFGGFIVYEGLQRLSGKTHAEESSCG